MGLIGSARGSEQVIAASFVLALPLIRCTAVHGGVGVEGQGDLC